MRYVKAGLAIGALVLAGALMAQNAEAKTPKPHPITFHHQTAPKSDITKLGDGAKVKKTPKPRKGKKLPNIGESDTFYMPPPTLPASITNPPQKTQKNPKPNYGWDAYCMVVCT